jgi:glycosyltransferase involved in cell wall biosynthesis
VSGALRLLYILRGGRKERLQLPPGAYPDEFFYGYTQLSRRAGWQAELRERRNDWPPGLLLQRLVHRLLNLSPDFGGARELGRDVLLRHDVVVSTSEPVLMMLARRRQDPSVEARLVLILMGAEKRIDHSPFPSITRRMLRSALAQMQAVIVVGEGERDYLLAEHLAAPDRLHLVHFGVDVRFWSPGPPVAVEGGTIFAVGNDDGRDFPLLLRSIGDHPLRVHTRLPLDRRGLPPTVEVTEGSWQGGELSDIQLRDLYRGSRFVVVPLRDSAQPQGQSATLQAMACGKAVVLTRTRGLWGDGLMAHGRNCHLVPPGDAIALREGIERLAGDASYRSALGAAARQTVEAHFTSDRMADEIASVLEGARR